MFELLRTRVRFRATNKAFLSNYFKQLCRNKQEQAKVEILKKSGMVSFQRKSQKPKSKCFCCKSKASKENENMDSELGSSRKISQQIEQAEQGAEHLLKSKFLDMTEQFNRGKDTIMKEIDIVNVVRSLRKLEQMQKILFSIPQNILLNYQKKNLID